MAVILLTVALIMFCINESDYDRNVPSVLIPITLFVLAFDMFTSPWSVMSIIDSNKIALVQDLNYICENYTEDKKQEAITERVSEYDNDINHSAFTLIRTIYWYPFTMHMFDNIDVESINEDNYIEKIILDK